MVNENDADIDEAVAPIKGMSPSRLAQLKLDLLLTPEERVRAAEETLKVDRLREAGVPRGVMVFDRYEDYFDYKWGVSSRRA